MLSIEGIELVYGMYLCSCVMPDTTFAWGNIWIDYGLYANYHPVRDVCRFSSERMVLVGVGISQTELTVKQ
ncbi:hypothetical protein KSX_00460 [Ktedonospora formicarum]|uniref:Uncharacterized protein n=1 Tax=Ktedonospora formicarum TaxID=2778364 RepID=A0A8J3HWG4_9CHLR|nr:hypothetical protein KSX_00460 [Ktedonospora formicarum]